MLNSNQTNLGSREQHDKSNDNPLGSMPSLTLWLYPGIFPERNFFPSHNINPTFSHFGRLSNIVSDACAKALRTSEHPMGLAGRRKDGGRTPAEDEDTLFYDRVPGLGEF